LLTGDYQAAMKACDGVLQIDPGDKDCQFVDHQARMESASKLAKAAGDKFEEGDTAAAYTDASEALRLDPTNLNARRIRDLARTARKTTAELN
jgi:Tfp pilus assembly protein PilF